MTVETVVKQPEDALTRSEPTREGQFYRPNVDILENPDELQVLVDLPGSSTDAINVHFEDGTLTIHGRVPPRQTEDTPFLMQEYGVADFFRTFQVSEGIDAARISADYSDGVLRLRLPKAEAVKPRKIAVRGG